MCTNESKISRDSRESKRATCRKIATTTPRHRSSVTFDRASDPSTGWFAVTFIQETMTRPRRCFNDRLARTIAQQPDYGIPGIDIVCVITLEKLVVTDLRLGMIRRIFVSILSMLKRRYY